MSEVPDLSTRLTQIDDEIRELEEGESWTTIEQSVGGSDNHSRDFGTEVTSASDESGVGAAALLEYRETQLEALYAEKEEIETTIGDPVH